MEEFKPESLDDVFGQDDVVSKVRKWVENDKIPQTILLGGPYGCGKSTIARIISKRLDPDNLSSSEINAAESRGIDDVRAWAESARFAPLGSAKVYIIDEMHQLTNAAQSALLKVVESPPNGIYFIFCTSETHKLLPALASRCTKLTVKLLDLEKCGELLKRLNYNFKQEVVEYIFSKSGGHARDMVKIAQHSLGGNDKIELEEIQKTLGVLTGASFRKCLMDVVGCTKDFVESERMLYTIRDEEFAMMFDNLIEEFIPHSRKLSANYFKLLQVKIARKEHLLTLRDSIVLLLSIMRSPDPS